MLRRYDEPLGNVVLEAWAQHIPVIASRTEGPSWFMRDYENGLMVEAEDEKAFARAIEMILSDKTLAHSVQQGGSQTLHTRYSEEAVTSAYFDLIRNHP